jgi:hypothetical protein
LLEVYGSLPDPTLNLTAIRGISDRNYRTDRYLDHRFDPEFSNGVKGAMLAMECSANAEDLIVEATAPGHDEAVFRSRLIVAMHLLSALREVHTQFHDNDRSTGLAQIASVLDDPVAVLLVGQGPRQLRNVAMHYGVDPSTPGLHDQLPMSGLVETFIPTTTFGDLNHGLHKLIRRIADLLSEWPSSISSARRIQNSLTQSRPW